MSDLVFVDTETLGLAKDAPIWEFAAIRRSGDSETQFHCFIGHTPPGEAWPGRPWLPELPPPFVDDYRRRYDAGAALREDEAAARR